MEEHCCDYPQVPPPPGTGDDSGFEFVNSSDCAGADQAETGDRNEIYKRLQDELVNQIKVFMLCCLSSALDNVIVLA